MWEQKWRQLHHRRSSTISTMKPVCKTPLIPVSKCVRQSPNGTMLIPVCSQWKRTRLISAQAKVRPGSECVHDIVMPLPHSLSLCRVEHLSISQHGSPESYGKHMAGCGKLWEMHREKSHRISRGKLFKVQSLLMFYIGMPFCSTAYNYIPNKACLQ